MISKSLLHIRNEETLSVNLLNCCWSRMTYKSFRERSSLWIVVGRKTKLQMIPGSKRPNSNLGSSKYHSSKRPVTKIDKFQWFDKWTSKKLKVHRIKLQLWWASSCFESFRLLEWQAENTASGEVSPREQSPVDSRFSGSLFVDVPGTATEQVRTCGFRSSSSLDKAPKMRDSVQLNSLENFLVTPPLQFLQKPGRYTPGPFLDQVCFLTDCSL